MKTLVIGAVVALVLAAPAPASVISPPPKSGHAMEWFHWAPSARTLQGGAGEFGSAAVVGLESMRDLAALRDRYDLDRVQALWSLHAAKVTVGPAELRVLLANAAADPRIRYVAPLGPRRRPLSMPNDPLLQTINPSVGLPYEWQFAAAHVDRALELSPGSAEVVVGTIDTGAADVPDLAGKVDGRWSISPDGTMTPQPDLQGNDQVGHGTAVASLIAANVNDGFGIAGFGGATHVIAFRDDDQGFTDTSVAIALTKLVSLGVRIVNMSIGGDAPDGPILIDAIHLAAANGVLLVASAGNDHGFVTYPAADLQPSGGRRSYGLAVGASNLSGSLASFSNSGQHLSLVAPGEYSGMCSGVLIAIPQINQFDDTCYPTWAGDGGARYAYAAGTSFAAPEVAGVAALIWAARPTLKNYQVADIIKQSARRVQGDGWIPTMGCGQLDAGAALELATSRLATDWANGDNGEDAGCSTAGNAPATWTERSPEPSVLALQASGKWGDTLRLGFRVGEQTHEVAATADVQKNGTTIARLDQGLFKAQPGQVYSFRWRAPKMTTTAAYRFCITVIDRTHHKSPPNCAQIRLR